MMRSDDIRPGLWDDLEKNTNQKFAIGVFLAFLSEGADFFEAALESFGEGLDGAVSNDSVMTFPDELVETYGGEEGQYGYVEFENPVGIDRVPFDEAYALFDIAADHYVKWQPHRADYVNGLRKDAKQSLKRLKAQHEKWKRQRREP